MCVYLYKCIVSLRALQSCSLTPLGTPPARFLPTLQATMDVLLQAAAAEEAAARAWQRPAALLYRAADLQRSLTPVSEDELQPTRDKEEEDGPAAVEDLYPVMSVEIEGLEEEPPSDMMLQEQRAEAHEFTVPEMPNGIRTPPRCRPAPPICPPRWPSFAPAGRARCPHRACHHRP